MLDCEKRMDFLCRADSCNCVDFICGFCTPVHFPAGWSGLSYGREYLSDVWIAPETKKHKTSAFFNSSAAGNPCIFYCKLNLKAYLKLFSANTREEILIRCENQAF